MTNDIDDHGGEPDEIARFLRERVARHQAPTRLRSAVVETLSPSEGRRRPSLWLPPALSALATAMVMLLWLAPVLPRSGGDPLQLLSHAVMTEHARAVLWGEARPDARSEEHTSELQSHLNLVCRLLLEKKKKKNKHNISYKKKKKNKKKKQKKKKK